MQKIVFYEKCHLLTYWTKVRHKW